MEQSPSCTCRVDTADPRWAADQHPRAAEGCRFDYTICFCPLHGAAPDLLVELERLVGRCNVCGGTGTNFWADDEHAGKHRGPCETCRAARRAIAKAKGNGQ